ncbi:hypothetical protein PR003_g14520 [Phytophthora rubi]|uniref:Uncharacterized protein n=1 Tax=Phytophthora rubi TaxID=129364 RepID=A0A6A3LLD1_9STRA|nr:hypothetical protein PR002_g13609 [Phytophthora rubi]KAE9332444.1 hypothetical protein PR003_g14520 [Phytophthora rubi]
MDAIGSVSLLLAEQEDVFEDNCAEHDTLEMNASVQ